MPLVSKEQPKSRQKEAELISIAIPHFINWYIFRISIKLFSALFSKALSISTTVIIPFFHVINMSRKSIENGKGRWSEKTKA